MRISILFPFFLIFGLLVTGCSEIGNSIVIKDKISIDKNVRKNNLHISDKITRINSKRENRDKFLKKTKDDKIIDFAYADNTYFLGEKKSKEIYLNVQYQF